MLQNRSLLCITRGFCYTSFCAKHDRRRVHYWTETLWTVVVVIVQSVPNFMQSKNYTIAIAWYFNARFSMSFEQSVRYVIKHNQQLYRRAEKVETSTTHTSHWECNYEANGLPSLRGSYAVADDDEDADDGAGAGDAGSAGDWGENLDFVVGGRRYWSWASVITSGRSSFL